jgi:hypothetical protein
LKAGLILQLLRLGENSILLARSVFTLFLVAFLGLALSASANGAGKQFDLRKQTTFKDLTVEVTANTRVYISGIKGTVRLVSTSGQMSEPVLHVHKSVAESAPAWAQDLFENLSYTVRSEGDGLFIEGKFSDAKSSVETWWASEAPELHFDLEIPARSIEVALRTGSIQVQNWKAPLAIFLVEGSARIDSGDGIAKLQIQQGDIRVDKHRGHIDLDTYAAKMAMTDVDGDISIANFNGDSSLSKVHGTLQIQASAGAVSIAKGSGTIDFETMRSGLVIQEFEGAIHGQAEDGSITASVLGEADVEIHSKQAPVAVHLPPGSSATLKLRSEDGAIIVPEPLKAAKSGEAKVVQGRMPASVAAIKGNVTVSTQTGTIRVR